MGGAPVSQDYANQIGADGYAADAASAVRAVQAPARRAGCGAAAGRRSAGDGARPSRTQPARVTSRSTARRGKHAHGEASSSAPRRWASACPTSCVKQGKCRECLVEVEEGSERLTPPAPQESISSGRFRLSCRARLRAAGEVRCHTLRRGTLRIETESDGLGRVRLRARSGGHPRRHTSCCSTTRRSPNRRARSTAWRWTSARRPWRCGSTTSRAARLGRHALVREPAALRRLRHHGAHPLRRRARRVACCSARCSAICPTPYQRCPGSAHDLRGGRGGQHDDAGSVLRPGRAADRPDAVSVDDRGGPRRGPCPTTSLAVKASRLRLPIHPDARVYGLPLIGSHVGADAAACVLATGVGEATRSRRSSTSARIPR